jgi:energy-coupling factor transporter ATP-binding protein EcfA2
MTKYFLKVYKKSSGQVDDQILTKAKKSFKEKKAIVLTGHKECGKTSVAVALASAYEEQQCLLLKKPYDIDKIDFPNICLVIIDEFAGKYRYEENEAYDWYAMFDHLYNAVKAGQMNVIITCDKGKLDKCINKIGRHAILDHVVDVPLQKAVVKSEVTERKLIS